MGDEIKITKELAAAGYVGKFGLTVLCIFGGALGFLFGYIFFGLMFFMLLGEAWKNFNFIAGGVLGVLVGVGMAIQNVEHGNLKARALVNNANWRR